MVGVRVGVDFLVGVRVVVRFLVGLRVGDGFCKGQTNLVQLHVVVGHSNASVDLVPKIFFATAYKEGS